MSKQFHPSLPFPCPECGGRTIVKHLMGDLRTRLCKDEFCDTKFFTRNGEGAERLTAYSIPGLVRGSDEHRERVKIYHSLLNTLEMGLEMGRVSRRAIKTLKRAGMKAGVEIL